MGILKNIFGGGKRSFQLKPDEIKPLLVNKGGCLATNMITIDVYQIGYMYREEPHNDLDNGWRFFLEQNLKNTLMIQVILKYMI